MKLVRWLRFSWDLGKVPEALTSLDPQFQIQSARKEDFLTLRNVVLSSFYLDSSWNELSDRINVELTKRFEELSEDGQVRALVITHGKRVIGGSLYCLDQEAPNHLLSGPCLLQEYSNRGLGTALLQQTLLDLGHGGLTTAFGLTKTGSAAAKFVYSKFNSVSLAYDPDSGG